MLFTPPSCGPGRRNPNPNRREATVEVYATMSESASATLRAGCVAVADAFLRAVAPNLGSLLSFGGTRVFGP